MLLKYIYKPPSLSQAANFLLVTNKEGLSELNFFGITADQLPKAKIKAFLKQLWQSDDFSLPLKELIVEKSFTIKYFVIASNSSFESVDILKYLVNELKEDDLKEEQQKVFQNRDQEQG